MGFVTLYAPKAVPHQVVDDEADLDEREAVRLGHPVHDVSHQVLQRVGRTVLLKMAKKIVHSVKMAGIFERLTLL